MPEQVDFHQSGCEANTNESHQSLPEAPSARGEGHELRELCLESRQAWEEVLSVTMSLHEKTMLKLEKMETRFGSLESLVEQKLLQSRTQSAPQSAGSCTSWHGGTGSEGLRKQILQTAAMEAMEMDIGQKVPGYAAKLLGEQKKRKSKSARSIGEVRKPEKQSSKEPSFLLEVERDPVAGGSQSQPPSCPSLRVRQRDLPGFVQPDAPEMDAKSVKPPLSEQPSVLTPEEPPQDLPRVQSGDVLSPKSSQNSVTPSMTAIKSVKSGRLHDAIASGHISEVFRLQEGDLVDNLSGGMLSGSSAGQQKNQVRASAVLADEQQQPCGQTEQQAEFEAIHESVESEEEVASSHSCWLYLSPLHHFLVSFVSKVLGLWPLFDVLNDEKQGEESHCSKIVCQIVSRLYHWFVIFGLLFGAILSGSRSALCIAEEDYECGHLPALSTDIALIVSACIVLTTWGGFWDYTKTTLRIAYSSRDISHYCAKHGLAVSWNMWSFTDALIMVILWLALLAGRVVILTVSIREVENSISVGEVFLFFLPFAVSTGVLCVAGFWQVRMSHAMRLIINDWSGILLMGDTQCWHLKMMWRLISGLFRKTSRAFEHCYTAFCMTIVSIAFAALWDARRGLVLESLASIVLACLLPGVLIVLASTTTACKRLPTLVSLVQPAEDDVVQDTQFMDLILFLSFSECGFFVWDTCVTLGLVQKFIYFTGAIAGTIGFQTGTFNFQ